MDFPAFFAMATGHAPYPYQARVATLGLPDVLEAPTGAGKTEAIVVPTLWWWFHNAAGTPTNTPRRLVIALPLRTLVEQTEERVRRMLANTGLDKDVQVRALMGGRMTRDALAEWRTNPEHHSIVIGTIDSVVSRALNRGYGQSRGTYPIDFALITNGAHIVVDEVQLCAQATATLRQVRAFQRTWGTAEPAGLTCVSATVLPEALDTVDNPFDPVTTRRVALDTADEQHNALARRLEATKLVRQLPDCGTPKALAAQVTAAHAPGTLTLVMVNTVQQAVATFQALQKATSVPSLLVHSHFRGVERARILETVLAPLTDEGRIVVSTQSLEAGVDLDARTLITETAPWSSLVQRAGRCNRTGDHAGAQLLWVNAATKGPYAPADLTATASALTSLEGQQVTARDLQSLAVAQTPEDLAIIRRADMLALFETAADQAGRDIDISQYIRSDEPLDVQVAWVDTARYRAVTTAPAVPGERWRCRVSMKQLDDFLGRDPRPRVLTFDTFSDSWNGKRPERIRPQQILLIDASDGGYDPQIGFSSSSRGTVPVEADHDGPEDRSTCDLESHGMGAETGTQIGEWVPLSTHLTDARQEATDLCDAIEATAPLPATLRSPIVAGAALHDVGKSHPIWQAAITSAGDAPSTDQAWAKSSGRHRLTFTDQDGQPRPNFRHELVSALMLLTPAGEQQMTDLALTPDQFDLCRYLVAAHHGHLRISPQDPRVEGTSGRLLLGLADGDELPSFDGAPAVADLRSTFGGGPDSWTARSLRLLAGWGPFQLAYAEMVVRMADWRASARSHQETT